ncbi:MAG: hypothetical protein COT73_08885 [Bdellovibrio sp. CG10_big_fil_rev_8_21_14_0_10_47_8]|nr:MAG: hypothetical protein COT73_08885 [Bdellovibrio sp. CG10_big_fil_rev_8_21_14_0_10_47_8]
MSPIRFVLRFALMLTFGFTAFALENSLTIAGLKSGISPEESPRFSKAIRTEPLKVGLFNMNSADKKISELFEDATRQADRLNEIKPCSVGREKVGYPMIEMTTTPTLSSNPSSCSLNKFIKMSLDDKNSEALTSDDVSENDFGFQRRFILNGSNEDCLDASKQWMKETLMGKNSVGKALWKSCGKDCSFANIIRIKRNLDTLPGQCDMTANLQVQCGPHREGSLSWKGSMSVAVKNNFSCELIGPSTQGTGVAVGGAN